MITVYSTTTCPACKVLKSKLSSKGILFEEVNIDEDAEAKAFILDAGFRSVPKMTRDGKFISIGDL